MAQFRKKPIVIEAMQWHGPILVSDYLLAFDEWMVANKGNHKVRYRGDRIIIPTLESDHEACPGDWIIRGVKNELYPCKPDIFAATYEPVEPAGQDATKEPSP